MKRIMLQGSIEICRVMLMGHIKKNVYKIKWPRLGMGEQILSDAEKKTTRKIYA